MNSVERVKKLCKENKIPISKLERDLGFSNGYIGQLRKGVFPDDRLAKIAEYFGVSVDYLMTGETINTNNPKISELIYEIVNKQMQEKLQSPHPYIPILGRVVAGIPVESVEDVIGKIQINENLARTGNFYALEVKGNSMQPRLREGDIVIVREQTDVESGDVAIVCVNGDEYTIKKIKKSKNGITLIPFNPAYETIFYSNEEIEKLPVEIKGRVVQFHGNL